MVIRKKILDFVPSRDGFQFYNSFKVSYRFLGLKFMTISKTFGFCGGMCYAADDIWRTKNKSMWDDKKTPKQGTKKFNILKGRQLDSLKKFTWAKVYDWQSAPDESHRLRKHSLGHRTKKEWPKVKKQLDGGKLATLCLIRVEGYTKNPSKNHQVLAYGYEYNTTSKWVKIFVYDPNKPNEDKGYVKFRLGQKNNKLSGIQIQSNKIIKFKLFGKSVKGKDGVRMRGFFHIAYRKP